MIINIKIKDLIGKIACKNTSNKIPSNDGQYPRIGWKHELGFTMQKNNVYYQYINIKDSPHYLFVCGNKSKYIEYMNTKGWLSGRKDGILQFQNLINTFNTYDPNIKYIEVVKEPIGYVIIDGLHRSSILFHKNPDFSIPVRVISNINFTKLPIKKNITNKKMII